MNHASIRLVVAAAVMAAITVQSTGSQSLAATPLQSPDKQQRQVRESDALATKQSTVINKIPGMNVQANDLKQESVDKNSLLNPVAWLFKPVTKLQAQSVRLEQQIMRLTGPIAALQPAMLGLENHVTQLQGKMDSLQTQMAGVQDHMSLMHGRLSSMQLDLSSMHRDMNKLGKPIGQLQGPIAKLEAPVSTIGERMDSLESQIQQLKILIGLVLTSIYIAAGLIAVGTPVAAIIVWRHRNRIMADSPQKST